MTVKEVFDSVLPTVNSTQAEAALKFGWTPQQLSQRMVRNSLRAGEFLGILDAIGVEVLFRNIETGQLIEVRRSGHGRRLRKMSDKIKFDTAASSALSNNFYDDGANEYNEDGKAQELYVDSQGRYFIAEYDQDDPGKDRITSIPAAVAAAFIEKYGTEINKQPK